MPSTNLSEAVAAARLSWQCNYTLIDARWALKQLHGLHQLILENRDELAKHASNKSSACANEKDIARLVGEISLHIQEAGQTTTSTKQTVDVPLQGQLEVFRRPAGVSVVVFGPENPLRWILGPLASSIAARNVTILASSAPLDHPIISLLEREIPKYLDQESVFLVPSLEPAHLAREAVHLVAIYDGSPEPYHVILSSRKTTFFDTSDVASNFAIISENVKSWTQIAGELQIASDSRATLQPDLIHGVFVRDHNIDALRSSLLPTKSAEPIVFDGLLREGGDAEFEAALASAKQERRLLLVVVRSVDRAFDTLIALSGPISQLALLGPEAESHEAFALAWLPVQIIAVGSIYPTSVPEVESGRRIFGHSIFRLSKSSAFPSLPGDIADIRAAYEGLVPHLVPEPRGERIGFFTQAEYMIKGAAATVGILVLAGAYHVARRYR